ncbi:arylacetamide deacetylase-like 3 [Sorex fumeus]|uniref:arylacetamide deacetylase-like 3 n=1 Tax=Sorex fumeus TaxID=62283 RepID=UPI0024AE3979|nr:arylacetamide deacetylase-like 3 [Sorex fumeus]
MVGLLLLWASLLVVGGLLVGTPLWVFCRHFYLVDIPADISHPKKLRFYHCIFELLMTWGLLLERLHICSMGQFVRFIHDLEPLKKDPDVVVTDLRFGTIPVKLYQPRNSSSTLRRGVVFYHGGGGFFGSLNTHHDICLLLCKESDSVVLSIGYRKMPEFKFPVVTNDCFAATVYFLRSLNMFGVDPGQVVVCGDSVGGGVSVVLCQQLLDCPQLPRIRAQVVIYPSLHGLDFQSPSNQQNNVPMLPRHVVARCYLCYLNIDPSWKKDMISGANLPPEIREKYRKWLGHDNIPERFKQRGYRPKPVMPLNDAAYRETRLVLDIGMSPLVAEDKVMSQMPEALIVSCEYDYLLDHSLLYKKRLEDLGVPVTWCHVDDGFHGVLVTVSKGFLHFPCSRKIMDAIVDFIKGL